MTGIGDGRKNIKESEMVCPGAKGIKYELQDVRMKEAPAGTRSAFFGCNLHGWTPKPLS